MKWLSGAASSCSSACSRSNGVHMTGPRRRALAVVLPSAGTLWSGKAAA